MVPTVTEPMTVAQPRNREVQSSPEGTAGCSHGCQPVDRKIKMSAKPRRGDMNCSRGGSCRPFRTHAWCGFRFHWLRPWLMSPLRGWPETRDLVRVGPCGDNMSSHRDSRAHYCRGYCATLREPRGEPAMGTPVGNGRAATLCPFCCAKFLSLANSVKLSG